MFARLTPAQLSESVDWIDQHGDYLYSYALGQLCDENDAEDLVQDTFLAALKARDQFHGHSSERTWLVSILRHKICDRFRQRCRERNASHSAPERDGNRPDESMLWIHETATECLSPSRHIDLKDFRQSLEIALHTLPPRIAQAFAMYEMEESSRAEVCLDLDISQANLWTMVHRARKQPRELPAAWRNEINDSSGLC